MPKTLQFADPKLQAKYVAYRAMLDAYKMERGCIDCGYAEHPAALDLDHRDPLDKDKKLAVMFTYRMERIQAELDKCEVRCANCHRIKSYEQGENGPRRLEPVVVEDWEWTLFSGLAASVFSGGDHGD